MYDIIGKSTGPGTIMEQVVRKNGILVIIDLGNFNTDGNTLKPEHKDWLDTKLIPVLKKYGLHVKLTGMASRSGDPHYNRNLSLSRLLHVKAYLHDHGIPEAKIPGPEIRAAGADLSVSKSKDDPDDRAVRITLAMGTRPKPLVRHDGGGIGLGLPVPEYLRQKPWFELKLGDTRPPNLHQPQPGLSEVFFPGLYNTGRLITDVLGPSGPRGTLSRNFRIRQLGEEDYGLFKVFGISGMGFQILDVTNSSYIDCNLTSGQIGIGTPVSFTFTGPWNDFTTPSPVTLGDFGGGVTFQSLFAIGPYSTNRITFFSDKVGYSVIMSTGFTFGATLESLVIGKLNCSEPRY